MTWNYRVIVRSWPPSPSYDGNEEEYGIYEVYYNEDGDVELITEVSVLPFGETLEELRADFDLQLKAFDLPALKYEDIANAYD